MVVPKTIFVVGVGRSGTTLLMSMLNAHPGIVFPPEFHFIRNYIVKYKALTFADLKEKLQSDSNFARLKLPIDQVLEPFQEQQRISLPMVYRHALQLYAPNACTLYIGDKDPKNIEHLPVLRTIAPDAYVFHIIRDPRDVFLSRTRADWSQQKSVFSHLLAYRSQLELGREQGRKLFADRYMEIQYETLITKPEQILHKICEHLDVPYVQDMLYFSESAKEIVAPEEVQWKGAVLQPLKTDNYQKWRTQLTKREILKIEAACEPIFADHTYDYATYQDATFREMLLSQYWNISVRFAAVFYKLQLTIKNYSAQKRLSL